MPDLSGAPDLRVLVLAAGAGRRFAGPSKLLAELDGRPVLEHVVELARPYAGVVVVGPHGDRIRAGVDLGRLEVVRCDDAHRGQARSLVAGLRAIVDGDTGRDVDGVLVLLGDQPRLGEAVVSGTVARFDAAADAVRPLFDGAPGHPVLLTRRVLRRALALTGDEGARSLLAAGDVRTWDATGLGDPRDVDTLADLDALRGSSPAGT